MPTVVDTAGLGAILERLRADGRTVLGPTRRDGVIALDRIESLDDLPGGVADEQGPGSYRLSEDADAGLFGQAAPATSWKRFVYPERTLLLRANRGDGSIAIVEPDTDTAPMAFFGIRSCDLNALGVLDQVFLDPAATDPTYAARRADVFVVAVTCGRPSGTCFCVSMGTGPAPGEGYDLAVTEIGRGSDRQYVIDAGSERGTALLSDLGAPEATPAELHAVDEVVTGATDNMGRRLDSGHPPLAAAHLDHPRWAEVAQRCLSCTNCTLVCPTCFCSTTEDTTDLAGTTAERWRRWDSCFTLDFSYLSGGSVRQSGMSRYRQWLLHKLVTWHDQYGTSGCVGCGRCITWCPVGIDITEEVAALAAEPGSPP